MMSLNSVLLDWGYSSAGKVNPSVPDALGLDTTRHRGEYLCFRIKAILNYTSSSWPVWDTKQACLPASSSQVLFVSLPSSLFTSWCSIIFSHMQTTFYHVCLL